MGKAILKPGQKPVKGIYCGMQYKVNSRGEQLMFLLRRPDDEQVRKNPVARAEQIIGDCVCEIQKRMRVQRDYGRYCAMEKNNNRLRNAIVDGYFQDLRKRPSKSKGYIGLTLDLTPT